MVESGKFQVDSCNALTLVVRGVVQLHVAGLSAVHGGSSLASPLRPRNQTNIKELLAMKTDCHIASRHLCPGQKVALKHIITYTANG